ASAAGELPANLLAPQLTGDVSLDATFTFSDPHLEVRFSWADLAGSGSWRPGNAPALSAAAPGLTVEVTDGNLEADFDGFRPEPFLAGVSGLAVELSGSAAGPLAAPAFSFDVESSLLTAAVTGRFAPELHADVHLDRLGADASAAAGPLGLAVRQQPDGSLHVSGDGTDVTYGSGGWAGRALLPLQALGQAHELTAVLSGSGPVPEVDAGITGPLVQGQLQFSTDLTADLEFSGAAADLPVDATVTGVLGTDGTWNARVDAQLTAGSGTVSPVAGLELSGTLSTVEGHGNVRAGPDGLRLLSFTVDADGGHPELVADLASLDAPALLNSLGLPDGQLDLSGQARLEFPAPDAPVRFSLAGNTRGRFGSSSFDVALGFEDGAATAHGTAAGQPLSASFTVDGGLLDTVWSGWQLNATLADSRLEGSVQEGAQPAGGSSGLQFAASFRNGLQPEFLTGRLGSVSFDLATPGESSLEGSVVVAGFPERLPLRLVTAPAPAVRTGWQGLQLEAALAEGGPLVTLTGTTEQLQLEADVRWQAGTGFSGSASAAGELPSPAGALPWTARASARPDGNLSVDGQLEQPAQTARRSPLAEFHGGVTADPFRSDALSGRLNVTANLATLLQAPLNRNVRFSVGAHLSGPLSAPSLSGTVIASGAVEASGRLTATSAGATVNLTGETVSAQLETDLATWSASAALDGLPLPELAAFWPDAELGFSAEGSGSFTNGSQRLELERLTVTGGGSTVLLEGTMLDDVFDGSAQVQLDPAAHLDLAALAGGSVAGVISLEGLTVAAPRSGRVHGDLTLQAATYSGSVSITGPPAALTVRGTASSGNGQDSLSVDWQPAASYLRATAELAGPAVTGSARVTIQDGSTRSASGSLDLPGGSVALRAGTAGELLLEGRGGWRGWQAALDPLNRELHASGSLADVHGALAGDLSLTGALQDGRPALDGTISGLEVAGAAFGTVSLSDRSGGLLISGDGLTAR
ncbi:MAG TPA: hypothetical protein VK092_09345, partial [Deinococcales bacterium]|nr:hypothetical protein [Deinococcales bacterium]